MTEKEQTNCYEISGDLLKELENSYPDKLPSYEPSAFELGKMVGAREVISKIILLTNPQVFENIVKEFDHV